MNPRENLLSLYRRNGYAFMPIRFAGCPAVQQKIADAIAEFGDKLSFCGTIGTQTTMPFGTPEEVREVVLGNLEIAGSKGGLMVCPTHLLEPEVPWANIDGYVRACIEFCE